MIDRLDCSLPRRTLRYKLKKLSVGECPTTWETIPLKGEDTHLHKCKRFKGHTSQHICNCGSTTRAEKRIKIGRNRQ